MRLLSLFPPKLDLRGEHSYNRVMHVWWNSTILLKNGSVRVVEFNDYF